MVSTALIKPQNVQSLLDPMRDPAWRGLRAQWLVEQGSRPKPPSQRDDEAIRTYRRFLIAWRKGGTTCRDKLFVENPGLYYAHQFFHHHDREWRAILEAKLLAREPNDFIAADFATCNETIQWYHDLFFDVRDRLHSRMYIVKTILGPSARRVTLFDDVMTENLRFLCYKNFGYFGGPIVLDTIVTGFSSSGTMPMKANQVDGWMDEAFKVALKQRSNMTAQTFTVNKFNCMELMQMHITLLGQAQAAQAAGGGQLSEFHQNIEMFFDQVPLAIGKAAKEGRTPETLRYEQTAVEPRAHEMLALAKGEVPDTLKGQVDFQPTVEEVGHE